MSFARGDSIPDLYHSIKDLISHNPLPGLISTHCLHLCLIYPVCSPYISLVQFVILCKVLCVCHCCNSKPCSLFLPSPGSWSLVLLLLLCLSFGLTLCLFLPCCYCLDWSPVYDLCLLFDSVCGLLFIKYTAFGSSTFVSWSSSWQLQVSNQLHVFT